MSRKFRQTNLDSDIALVANHLDCGLVNPWGIVIDDNKLWVAVNGYPGCDVTGAIQSFSYDGCVDKTIYVRNNLPTGLVVNSGSGFTITMCEQTGPSKLIVVTESGTIEGYNHCVDECKTIVLANDPCKSYTGAAITDDGNCLFVTDFKGGKIEKYHSDMCLSRCFTDNSLVNSGYNPYNVAVIDGLVFVAFARYTDDSYVLPGVGNGFIDVFDTEGCLIKRFTNRGQLNAPWALVKYGDSLVVSNFGDGRVLTYDLLTGDFTGDFKIHRVPNDTLIIDGIQGMVLSDRGHFFFTAGLDGESTFTFMDSIVLAIKTHGLIGKLH